MRVEVYWNLRRRCYSVRDKATGRVVAHRDTVHLRDVKLRVGQAARARIAAGGAKEVHAYVDGVWITDEHMGVTAAMSTERLTYNPRRDQFWNLPDKGGAHAFHADSAWLTTRLTDSKHRVPVVQVGL